MRRTLQALAGVAALTLSGAGAWAQDPGAAQSGGQSQQRAGQSQGQQPGQSQSGSQQDAPEGFVLIQERIVYLMGQAPQQHLLESLEKMHQNNPRAAAGEIRQAAGYIEMQASRAQGESRQALDDAAKQLNDLAKRVASKTEKVQPAELTKTFAQAGHALAKHHQTLAKQALEKDRAVAAGHELESAAQALRQAMIWSGQKADQELAGTLQNAMVTAYELRNEEFPADQQQQASGQAQEGEAQLASARESGKQQQQPGDPRVGTTRAEGQNIKEHAKKVVNELDKDIQQLGQAIQQFGGQQQRSGGASGQGQQGQPQQSGQSPSGPAQAND